MKLNRRQIQRLILREMAEMGMGGDIQSINVRKPEVAFVKAYLAGYEACEKSPLLKEAYLLGYEVCESGGGKTGIGGINPEGIVEPLIVFLEEMGYSDPFAEGVGSDLLEDFLARRGYK